MCFSIGTMSVIHYCCGLTENACENGGNFRRKNLKYTSPNDSGEVANDESGNKSIQESMDVTKSDPESSQFPDPPAAFSNAKEEVRKGSNVKAVAYNRHGRHGVFQ